jgi:dTDP-4-dehydrorhamnose 3,5-epimerase
VPDAQIPKPDTAVLFLETPVDGAWIVEPEPRADERGFFARVWDRELFAARGLSTDFVQCNNSASRHRGILRGLHWQAEPFGEAKLVRCVRGSVYDVVADTRLESVTAGCWAGVDLSAANRRWLYVPAGCAHGYLALEDDAEVLYAVTRPYTPAAERGIRWDDPAFGISWPQVGEVWLSQKDRSWPDFGAR